VLVDRHRLQNGHLPYLDTDALSLMFVALADERGCPEPRARRVSTVSVLVGRIRVHPSQGDGFRHKVADSVHSKDGAVIRTQVRQVATSRISAVLKTLPMCPTSERLDLTDGRGEGQ
jgi:hypothetical protein